jgi:hypothetical protein
MGNHRRTSKDKDKVAGGVLLGAVASGVAGFAAAALGGAGTAGATCASISGIGNSADCTSSLGSFAVGLGPGTDATAAGLFSGAIANGLTNPAGSPPNTTLAVAAGPAFDFAYAGGTNTVAAAGGGPFDAAITQGDNSAATAFGIGTAALNVGNGDPNAGPNIVTATGVGAIAGNLANGGPGAPNFVTAGPGFGVSAFNVAGDGNAVNATGALNNATNFVGNGNFIQATGGTFNPANPLATTFGGNVGFNLGGNSNTVLAGPNGPFAIAGALNSSGNQGPNSIVQNGPGTNIK